MKLDYGDEATAGLTRLERIQHCVAGLPAEQQSRYDVIINQLTTADPAQLNTTTDGEGNNILHVAAQNWEHATLVNALIQLGMDVNRRTSDGLFTPLHLAAIANNYGGANYLLRAGADREATIAHSGATPAMLAIQHDSQRAFESLLTGDSAFASKLYNVTYEGAPYAVTLAHVAAKANKPWALSDLHDAGVDLTLANGSNFTPSEVAQGFGSGEVLDRIAEVISAGNPGSCVRGGSVVDFRLRDLGGGPGSHGAGEPAAPPSPGKGI